MVNWKVVSVWSSYIGSTVSYEMGRDGGVVKWWKGSHLFSNSLGGNQSPSLNSAYNVEKIHYILLKCICQHALYWLRSLVHQGQYSGFPGSHLHLILSHHLLPDPLNWRLVGIEAGTFCMSSRASTTDPQPPPWCLCLLYWYVHNHPWHRSSSAFLQPFLILRKIITEIIPEIVGSVPRNSSVGQ